MCMCDVSICMCVQCVIIIHFVVHMCTMCVTYLYVYMCTVCNYSLFLCTYVYYALCDVSICICVYNV